MQQKLISLNFKNNFSRLETLAVIAFSIKIGTGGARSATDERKLAVPIPEIVVRIGEPPSYLIQKNEDVISSLSRDLC